MENQAMRRGRGRLLRGLRSLMAMIPATVAASCWAGPSMAQTGPSVLQKIAAAKRITIGYRAGYPPYSDVMDGKPAGYVIDLCQQVVDGLRRQLGIDRLDIEFVTIPLAARFVMMREGRMDMECAATTITAERQRQVNFSIPIFFTATRFVALRRNGYKTFADLAGRTVASLAGTSETGELSAANRQRKLNIAILLCREDVEAFAAVKSERAAAYVMDDVLLAGVMASWGRSDDLAMSEDALGATEAYGIMLPLGDDAFTQAVNAALKASAANGRWKEIYNAWFLTPNPATGRSPNLPLSPDLEASLARLGG
ncbi:amino acid ABC transporter substrate-binding protein [Methylobacterium terricola]|uniref:Amino acid ABC transporter substrate-binding protein n=1 Tax=Methylobacterium terricola TaxID=2583531 RepID=A0A5C4LJ40_9HYPH|nr:amino acid ABC transporter substrate-binding protein [Methylobacterium terricola]TNC12896.1 amino acid ABC transporter substrate-binding protein [Methylobacterium terricola]